MPAIISNTMRIQTGDAFKNELASLPVYVYFGGTDPWDDEQLPPDAVDSTEGRISALSDVQGLKRLQPQDIVSVLPRTDWIENTVYDQYTDKANIIDDKNPETNDFYRFYVVTDEFNVYKCLSNNYRSQSTVKPSGTSTTPFVTPDGYKWKYMYTIKTGDAFKFMTPNWVPCYSLYVDDGSAQWDVQTAAVPGSIDHIEVIFGGENYISTDAPVVTITGDGTGASAVAEIDDATGKITAITVTDPGQDYTSATVEITGTTGAGAEADALISPINGHGSDARSELGATYKMSRVSINGSEGGILPTDISFRNVGIISEPRSFDAGLELYVDSVGSIQVGDIVTGQSSASTATVRSLNKAKNVLYASVVSGTFEISEELENGSVVTRLNDSNNLPLVNIVESGTSYKALSGEPLYFSNRENITRNSNQIEELRLVIAF